MTLEFSGKIFEISSYTKFQENPSTGSLVVPCGRTDTTRLIVVFRNLAKRAWKITKFRGVTNRFLSWRIQSLRLRPVSGWCYPSIPQADAEAFGLRWRLRPIPATSLQITRRLQVPCPCLGYGTHKWARWRTVHDGDSAKHNISQSKYGVAKNC